MQPVIKEILIRILKTASLVFIGIWIGWMVFSGGNNREELHQHQSNDASATTWTCSMDPQVRAIEPGKCPICGMDLIPLQQEESSDPGVIQMTPSALQLAGVRTEKVSLGQAEKDIRLTGKVQLDERSVFSQSAHLEGRIEQLLVNYTGEYVKKGQVLAYIYAPDLVAAQHELFLAKRLKDSQPGLFQAAKEKLKNWKLTDAQIDTLMTQGTPQEKFPILADVSGQVKAKKVNLGDYITRGTPIYEIMDLSRVWVLFDTYESDLIWVKPGSKVIFTVQSFPGEEFSGVVSFIDPVINSLTRVATARVEMINPGQRLKPEMFVTGHVRSRLSARQQDLIIPKSAVLWTGERSVVYIKQPDRLEVSFYLQEVVLGPTLGDFYVVKSGLKNGDEIATSGTFSIDAAAQLAGKASVMNLTTSPTPKLNINGAPDFQKHIDHLVSEYLALKDALVKSQPAEAKSKAQALKALLKMRQFNGLESGLKRYWDNHRQSLEKLLDQFLSQSDLEVQRVQFKVLSEALIPVIETFGSTQTLYVQHCPMAMNNLGADWISSTAEIFNPYFGDAMLKCGKVVKTLQK